MKDTLDRASVVRWWAILSTKDYFASFCLEEEGLYEHSVFFAHQGLEKASKAYLLGVRASEYESLPESAAKEKIDKMARGIGHNLSKMLKTLVDSKVIGFELLSDEVTRAWDISVTGEQMAEILDKAYEESRYPVPSPLHKGYLVERYNVYWDPLRSSDPVKFARRAGMLIINAVEKDFGVEVRTSASAGRTGSDIWERFRRVFFG